MNWDSLCVWDEVLIIYYYVLAENSLPESWSNVTSKAFKLSLEF